MADEQAVVYKALQGAHRRILGFGWQNDRERSELVVQEDGGLRHDEVGLEFIGDFRIGESIEVGESDRGTGRAGETGVGVRQLNRVTRLVMPGLEMRGFRRTNGQQNAQHFDVAHALSKRRIKTVAALLDESKVEAGRVGDGLRVDGNTAWLVRIRYQVLVAPGNGRVLAHRKRRNRL